MNYLKDISARIGNPRAIAIIALALIVLALSMVDALDNNDHQNDNPGHQASKTR